MKSYIENLLNLNELLFSNYLITPMSSSKLLNGAVGVRRKFESDMNTASSVLNARVSLENL